MDHMVNCSYFRPNSKNTSHLHFVLKKIYAAPYFQNIYLIMILLKLIHIFKFCYGYFKFNIIKGTNRSIYRHTESDLILFDIIIDLITEKQKGKLLKL